MQLPKSDINTIISEITALLPDSHIFLFGSYAKGYQTDSSDLDICVISSSFPGRQISVIHKIRSAIADKITLPIDILLFQKDEFDKNSKLKPTIEYSIAKEGILLNA